MQHLHLFITILAWVALITATIVFIVCGTQQLNYTNSDTQAQDQLKGIKKSWKKTIKWSFVIMTIAAAYLLAFNYID